MQIYIYKENDEIITKMKNKGEIVDFDYVVLINELFANKKPSLEFDSTISEGDKEKIELMYNEICKTIESDDEEA